MRHLAGTAATRLLCVGALLLVSVPALAADEANGEAPPGLMDPVLSTFVWAALIFLVVLALLWKLAWGPLIQALDDRETKIRDSLEAADRMRAEQEKFQAEQEQILAAARKEANEIVAEGKRDAEAVKEKIVQDAKSAAEDTKDRAVAEIDRAKDLAVVEIHQRAVDLSVTIAEKLVGHAVSVDDQERLVQETIQQYENQAKN
jgi:F-type H+-transporting ATPase subunit b